MSYITIILGLLEQRPLLYEQLRRDRQLLPALNRLARDIKSSHTAWQAELARIRPDSPPLQLRSEALELALAELENEIPFSLTEEEPECCSLVDAMAFLRRPTPSE